MPMNWLGGAMNKLSGRFQRWLEKATGAFRPSPARDQPQFGQPDYGQPPGPPSALGLGPEGPPGGEKLESEEMDDAEARQAREWHVLSSSNVGETRYIAEEQILEVRFLNNYYYQYFDVPAEIFRDFITASSPGRFVWNVIRANGYAYDRIGAGVIPSYRQPSGWNPWKRGTHGRTQKDRVARVPLPEEVAAHGTMFDPSSGLMVPLAQTILGGESVKVPHVRLKLKRWANDWRMPPRS